MRRHDRAAFLGVGTPYIEVSVTVIAARRWRRWQRDPFLAGGAQQQKKIYVGLRRAATPGRSKRDARKDVR